MAERRKKDSWGDAVEGADWASYLDPAPGDLRIVQALFNTVDDDGTAEEWPDAKALTNWLKRWRLVAGGATLTDENLQKALEVRRDLRALKQGWRDGELDRKIVRRLDRAADDVLLRVRFQGAGETHFEPVWDGFEGFLARLFQIIAQAGIERTWHRLQLCPGSGCGRAFFDTSSNRNRKWCSMQRCGNRAKAREFRRRHPGFRALAG